MPSPLFHPEIMDHDAVISSQHNGVALARETEQESREEDHQEALRFALDQLSLMALEKVDCGGGGGGGGGLSDSLDGTQGPGSESCNGVGGGGYVDLQMLDHPGGSRDSPSSCSPSPEYYGSGGYHMSNSHTVLHGEQSSILCSRKRSVNMTECVPVPSSEHVAEIVGRQGRTASCCVCVHVCLCAVQMRFVDSRLFRHHAGACCFFVWVAPERGGGGGSVNFGSSPSSMLCLLDGCSLTSCCLMLTQHRNATFNVFVRDFLAL